MSLINVADLSKRHYIGEENDSYPSGGAVEVVGKLKNSTSPKFIKKINIFRGSSSSVSQNVQTEISENIKKISSFYRQNKMLQKPPKYVDLDSKFDLNNQKQQRDIEQLISNTFLLANKQKQYIVSKIFYNSFNNLDNPILKSCSNKKIKVSMDLVHDVCDANNRDFYKQNTEENNANYSRRRSSVVSAVISDLYSNLSANSQSSTSSVKSSKFNRDEQNNSNNFTQQSVSTNDSNEFLWIDRDVKPKNSRTENYAENSNTCVSNIPFKTTDFLKPTVSNARRDDPTQNLERAELNLKYEKALNTDPRVVVLPSIMCKSPSEDGQRHRDIRRLSRNLSTVANENDTVNKQNNSYEDSSSENDTESDDLVSINNGLLRVSSRYAETPNSLPSFNLELTGKEYLLKGSITIKNMMKLPCLLINNMKIMLCGYKASYEHFVLNDAIDNEVLYENLTAETESLNGFRVTKPFIQKELNLLNEKNYAVILEEETIPFQILIDSREFPSTLNCQYGKIEYRLECYINAVNVGNIILNDKIVIIKSLEPSISNLINQNDSVLKQDSPLTVYNKILEHAHWKIRYKTFDFQKDQISKLVNEDEYLDNDYWGKILLKNSNLLVTEDVLKSLQEPKILYDVFLASKTIVFNEPFEFFFKIKPTADCINDWNLTECAFILEQNYCFPSTTKLNDKGERHKTHKMKYKKVFFYPIFSQKFNAKDKVKHIFLNDVRVESDLAIYDSVFSEYKNICCNSLVDKIVPHYDELNTLYPESNKVMKNIVSVSHKIKINLSVETLPSPTLKHKLKKQFSITLPIFLITSSTLSTMTLPLYEE